MGDLAAVILAAGKGTRMKSRLPKVLHPLAGRPMIRYPLDLARRLCAEPIVVVVGHGAHAVQRELDGDDLRVVTQEPQLGTGHAVGFAREALGDHRGDLLILCGDVPLLTEETARGLLERHRRGEASLTVLTGPMDDPTGYGRIIRGAGGEVRMIVEEKDATEAQRAIREVNGGTYCARGPSLFRALEAIRPDNVQGEYYLTDAVALLASEGVEAFSAPSHQEFMGINDRIELAQAEEVLQWRQRRHWMREGVTLTDPSSVFMDVDVEIGRDTLIDPNVVLRGGTRIGRGCRIGTGCILDASVLEDGVTVRPYSVIAGSRVAEGAAIGPFAHLRAGNRIGAAAEIGNFVEVKNCSVGRGSKASHLTYLGDAELGEGVNIGAGTITCNYDGRAKHRTVIEEDVFVGSGTQLVAPVRVGKGALVGAGSTITRDVPPGAMALSRPRQVNRPGRAQGPVRKREKRG